MYCPLKPRPRNMYPVHLCPILGLLSTMPPFMVTGGSNSGICISCFAIRLFVSTFFVHYYSVHFAIVSEFSRVLFCQFSCWFPGFQSLCSASIGAILMKQAVHSVPGAFIPLAYLQVSSIGVLDSHLNLMTYS